jgi:hypothetical protein
MEEDEIEQWYEDEKQKAMDEYLKELESNKNKDEAEKMFNAKMDDTTKRYNQLMAEKISGKGKNNIFKDFISRAMGKFNLINRK